MSALTYRNAIAPRAGSCRRALTPSARGNWSALGSDITGTGFDGVGSQPIDRQNHAGFSLGVRSS